MKRFDFKLVIASAAMLAALSCSKDDKPSVLGPEGEDPSGEKPERWLVAAEQSKHRIIVVNTKTGDIEWEWNAAKSGLPAAHQKWFNTPDEVKPVYNGDYFLITASGGGVGIVRRKDSKMMFYAQPKGNPHSAEVLPDGNIVVASSTDGTVNGDKLNLYVVDTLNSPATAPAATYPLTFGHNAVWDRRNEVLWATAGDVLNAYKYSYIEGKPALVMKETIDLPAGHKDAHDLFPVHGEERLWLSSSTAVFRFDVRTRSFEKLSARTNTADIKSISSGPGSYPIMMLRPTQSWWSYNLIDTNGSPVYVGPVSFRIYKGRWLLDNTFSYPEKHEFVQPE